MIYTYSKLGNYGAWGNQAFQLASTIGIALANGGRASFPGWGYQDYFSFPPELFDNMKGDIDLSVDGDYLQDLKHFAHCEDLIRQYFRPTYEIDHYLQDRYDVLSLVENYGCQVTAIHLRRGDYLNLPMHHPVCELSYFEQGMDALRAETDVFLVFSDDIEWCKQQELFKDCEFAQGNDPTIDKHLFTGAWPLSVPSVVQDLHMMAKCQNHIISNSTFSFWGAWLANAGKVYYPNKWYGRHLSHIDVENTMIPKNGKWIPIEREIP